MPNVTSPLCSGLLIGRVVTLLTNMTILQKLLYLGCQPKQLRFEIFLMRQMGSDWLQNFILEIVIFLEIDKEL